MKWAPPPKGQQNGEIVNYVVEYIEEDSNGTVVNDTAQGMMYTAENLTTDRTYQFRVAATTVNGTGPFSNRTEVTTIPTGKCDTGMMCLCMYVHIFWAGVCAHVHIRTYAHSQCEGPTSQAASCKLSTLALWWLQLQWKDGSHHTVTISVVGTPYTAILLWYGNASSSTNACHH